MASLVLDLLDEALTTCARITALLRELKQDPRSPRWEHLATIRSLQRSLGAVGVHAWFGARHLSGATLELGSSPPLTLSIPDLSALIRSSDLEDIERDAPGALSASITRVELAAQRLQSTRDACERIATRLRWRCE